MRNIAFLAIGAAIKRFEMLKMEESRLIKCHPCAHPPEDRSYLAHETFRRQLDSSRYSYIATSRAREYPRTIHSFWYYGLSVVGGIGERAIPPIDINLDDHASFRDPKRESAESLNAKVSLAFAP